MTMSGSQTPTRWPRIEPSGRPYRPPGSQTDYRPAPTLLRARGPEKRSETPVSLRHPGSYHSASGAAGATESEHHCANQAAALPGQVRTRAHSTLEATGNRPTQDATPKSMAYSPESVVVLLPGMRASGEPSPPRWATPTSVAAGHPTHQAAVGSNHSGWVSAMPWRILPRPNRLQLNFSARWYGIRIRLKRATRDRALLTLHLSRRTSTMRRCQPTIAS